VSAQRFIVTNTSGTLDAEAGNLRIIEQIAMRDGNRVLPSLRDHQMLHRAVSANGAGKDS
jgi:hypothetical protein